MVKRLLYILSIVLLGACSVRKNADFLNEVNATLQEDPLTALVMLESVDLSDFSTPKQKAEYSLLYASALDANYIDTTDIGIIKPALRYARHMGDADFKFKTLYHFGRILYNREEYGKAVLAYQNAAKLEDKIGDNSYLAMLYASIAACYYMTCEDENSLKWSLKEYEHIEKLNNPLATNRARFHLALDMQNLGKYEAADSLFNLILLEQSDEDTPNIHDVSNSYAYMLISASDDNAARARELFENAQSVIKDSLDAEICATNDEDYLAPYAYCLLLTGDEARANAIFDSLMPYARSHADLAYWIYRKASKQGDYESAFKWLELTTAIRDSLDSHIRKESIANAQVGYYEIATDEARKKIINNRIAIALLFLLATIAIGLVFRSRKRQREKYAKELVDMSRRYEGAQLMLQQAEEDSQRLNSLESRFVQIYKERFVAIRDLCDTFVRTKARTDGKDILYKKVAKIFSEISNDSESNFKVEDMINSELDGILDKLDSDLGGMSAEDKRVAAYFIIGLDASLISDIMGISTSSVYTKKSRLREKIKGLDSPNRDLYLDLI